MRPVAASIIATFAARTEECETVDISLGGGYNNRQEKGRKGMKAIDCALPGQFSCGLLTYFLAERVDGVMRDALL